MEEVEELKSEKPICNYTHNIYIFGKINKVLVSELCSVWLAMNINRIILCLLILNHTLLYYLRY